MAFLEFKVIHKYILVGTVSIIIIEPLTLYTHTREV